MLFATLSLAPLVKSERGAEKVVLDGLMNEWTSFLSPFTCRLYTAVHREGKKTRVTLVMKNLDPLLDKGIYHCVANNSLGKVSQSFELWVEGTCVVVQTPVALTTSLSRCSFLSSKSFQGLIK